MSNDKRSKLAPFPNDLDHPKKKEDKKWGNQAAKAIYSNFEHHGPSLFYNDREFYEKCLSYALGDQNPDQYKPILGINPKDAKKTWVAGIRFQIKNYATKRINVAVSKQSNRKFEPTFNAIDALSIDAKANYKSNLKAFIENSEWLQEINSQVSANLLPEGLDISKIPTNADELELHMQMDHKLRDEMELEMGVKFHMTRNEWDELDRQTSFDRTVFGIRAMYAGMDENMMPVLKRFNPSKVIVPYSETQDFNRIKYWGYVDEYTVSEFKKMVGDEFDKERVEKIVDEHASKNPEDYYDYQYGANRHRNVDKITVMQFEYRTANQFVHVEMKDELGNQRFIKKPYDYYKTPREQRRFGKRFPDQRLSRVSYDAVYTGYWVVGSDDITFGWKLKENQVPGPYPGTIQMGLKLRAPNMVEGRITAIGKQIIPVCDDLQSYSIKIQHIIARAIPKGMGIDLYALRKASLKWDGKEMSDQEKIEMFLQSGIFVFDSSDRYKPGSNYKPFIEAENGLAQDIQQYLALIQQSLFELEEITGINKVAAASSLSSDTLVGTAEIQQQSTETAFDYLYYDKEKMFIDCSKTLGKLHVMSVRAVPHRYVSVIGQDSIDFLTGEFDPNKKDYGIYAEAIPTQEEWTLFYRDIEQAKADGLITTSDKIMLRRITNLKQAQMYLKVIEDRRDKARQQEALNNVEANSKANSESLNETHNLKLKELEAQHGYKMTEKDKDADNLATASELKREEIRLAELMRGDSKSDQIKDKGVEDRKNIKLEHQLEPEETSENNKKQ